MRPFLAIADLHEPKGEPFAVLAIDPTMRIGNGVQATVVSLHWTREDAAYAIARADQTENNGGHEVPKSGTLVRPETGTGDE